MRRDCFHLFWLFFVCNVYLSLWDLLRCHSDKPRGYRYSQFSHPPDVQSIKYPEQSRKTKQPVPKSSTTAFCCQISKVKIGRSWWSFHLFYFFSWHPSMKAIVSKTSPCQERNCPLYLAATFKVEVHFDSCFLSPREDYISVSWGGGGWGERTFHFSVDWTLFCDHRLSFNF